MTSRYESDGYDSDELYQQVHQQLIQEEYGQSDDDDSDANYGPDGRILPTEDELEEMMFLDDGDDDDESEEEEGEEHPMFEYDSTLDRGASESDTMSKVHSDNKDGEEEDLLGDIGADAYTSFEENPDEQETLPDEPSLNNGESHELDGSEQLEMHKPSTTKEKYKQYWDRFKTKSGNVDHSDGGDGERQPAKKKGFILHPSEKPFLEDPIEATLDVAINMFGEHPERTAYQIFDCDCSDFILMEDQFTTIGGKLQTQKNFVIETIKRYTETERALQQQINDFEEQERSRNHHERGGINEYELSDFVDGSDTEIDLAKERLEALASKAPAFTGMNTEREYVPAEHPMLKEMQLIRQERLERDGCSNIVRAMAKCPICLEAGSTNTTPDVASEHTIELYAMWTEFSVMRCKETAWTIMAKHWNEKFVYPFTRRGQRSRVPELTPSHMDIHFTECISSNIIPELVKDLIRVQIAEDCALQNGVFAEERVAGKRTGKISLTTSGHSSLLKLQKQKLLLMEKLTNYSMVAKFLSGTAVAPLPGLLCGKKKLGLKDCLELRPKKNESEEANANRAMRLLLGGKS